MEFTLRADPGVSGGISGRMGSLNYDTRTGGLSGSANFGGLGQEGTNGTGSASQGVDTGLGGDLIVQKIPMAPFTPFRDAGGKVSKRAGGPYVAVYEENGEKITVKWNAKQMGGEHREPPTITPEMERQIEELRRRLNR